MSYELKEIKLMGYTTDFNVCDCCGKENLRGTIAILDLTHGVVVHFGTTCAVKADKYDTLEAFNKAKKKINAEVRRVEDWKRFAWGMRRKFNIAEEKIDALADAFVSHMSNTETKWQRFDWEGWK